MATLDVGGAKLFWQEADAGPSLVLVHGSWGDADNWAAVAPGLAKRFRVVTWDRRGHTRSSAPPGQGSLEQDADDLAALIERLGLAPAFVVGNSGGALVTLRLAARRQELFRGLSVHEPPAVALLGPAAMEALGTRALPVIALIEQGRDAEAAERFMETIALGPGSWATLPQSRKDAFVHNARTFLDETREQGGLDLDLAALGRFRPPALLTRGEKSPPMFAPIVEKLAAAMPQARRHVFAGAGHVPHITHPAEFVAVISAAAG